MQLLSSGSSTWSLCSVCLALWSLKCAGQPTHPSIRSGTLKLPSTTFANCPIGGRAAIVRWTTGGTIVNTCALTCTATLGVPVV